MRKRILYILVILFVGINIILIYTDDEGKVDRLAFVRDWSQVETEDISESVDKQVVFTSSEEQSLYFESNNGMFDQFFVEVGEAVTEGDPLYVYRVHRYDEAETQLNNEIEKINREIQAIESAIEDMESLQLSTDLDPSHSYEIVEDQFEFQFEVPQSTAEISYLQQQFINEKEKELAQKEAEKAYVENQLNELVATGDQITVESPIDGRVKEINQNLSNPIITIQGNTLEAAGVFSEVERKEAMSGNEAEIVLDEITLSGTIGKLSEVPTSVVDDTSMYDFRIVFDEEQEVENILPGYHALASITLKESLQATVVKEDNIRNDSVWKMEDNGLLVKTSIETGINMDDLVEVTSGLTVGDYIADGPRSQLRNHAYFITPIQLNRLSKDEITTNDVNWKKYVVTGILSR